MLAYTFWGSAPNPAGVAYCFSFKPLASFIKQKSAQNQAYKVFEILPLIIFVHHAGGMQTRSTPSTTLLIWSLTNDIAPEAYLGGGGTFFMAPPLLTLPFSKKEQMASSD